MSPRIETERLSLRPFGRGDGDAVVGILNDLSVSRWLSVIPHPFTQADLRLVKSDGRSRWPDLMAITRQGAVIGGISCGKHLGYYLRPDQWGQGYASEAARAVVDFSFQELGRDKVKSGYFIGNQASARILIRLGFKEIGGGTQHCAALKEDRPHKEMRLSREDWEARQ